MDFREYARAFDEVERDFENAVAAWGVPFEEHESAPRAERVRTATACGCRCENATGSLWRNWVSPACVACRTGEETATFFVDLRCTKQCYFCFNPNQDNYEYFLAHKRNIVAELEQAHKAGVRFKHVAVTGGEPMLYRDHVCAFLRRAHELFPGVHTRLYTSGDLLDESGLRQLAESGLSEIRFSVKPADVGGGAAVGDAGVSADVGDTHAGGATAHDRLYALMAQAVDIIPDVVIEVPVIPGSLADMQDMLRRADAIGVRGVNLLEFCFPLHNAEEFRKRGFKLRKHPYNYLYDYWYGGGIPVAGSETEALALMEFAARENLALGVHYCSSDNKNTGQIFQQNKAFASDAALRARYPWMAADPADRFLKCAKAFGTDAHAVCAWAKNEGVTCGFDPDVPAASFPLEATAQVRAAFPQATLCESVNVVEQQDDGALDLREVAVSPIR
ncbi:MAG: radical SAM protein [Eggerthellaceae bacterium]|nr:radical SAM protein [Eggerthellaceae bacterium]